MKKTNEQIKADVKDYLQKTSKHLFIKEDGTYFKVLFNGDDTYSEISDGVVITHDINKKISYYGENTKNVIKHQLFLNKKMIAVRRSKLIVDELLKLVKA